MTDELSPKARAFLREVHDGDDPSADDYRRVHDAVHARIAVGVAAGAASLLTSKTATAVAAPSVASAASAGSTVAATSTALAAAGVGATLTTKILAAVLVVGAVAGGAAVVHVSRPSAAPALATVVAPLPETRPTTPSVLNAAPAVPAATPAPPPAVIEGPANAPPPERPTIALAAVPGRRLAAAPPAPAPAPAPASEPTPTPVTGLDAEIAMLRDARAALRGGDGAGALALLDRHDRQFPGGALGEDAAAERIFALCAMGRTAQATSLATAFLASHPTSPYAATVRSSCGGGSR